jgi:hypothetical protein
MKYAEWKEAVKLFFSSDEWDSIEVLLAESQEFGEDEGDVIFVNKIRSIRDKISDLRAVKS